MVENITDPVEHEVRAAIARVQRVQAEMSGFDAYQWSAIVLEMRLSEILKALDVYIELRAEIMKLSKRLTRAARKRNPAA